MENRKNVNRKLAAGMPGTKKMVEKYGENLVCVRYRYDVEKKVKYKTVELIIDKGFWDKDALMQNKKRIVYLRIKFEETDLRKKVKSNGGIWIREKNVWELDYGSVRKLGLIERIIETDDFI